VAKDIHARNIEDNEKAYMAMVDQGINVIEPQGADLQTWKDLEKEARALVVSGSDYSPEILEKLQKLQAEYKAQAQK